MPAVFGDAPHIVRRQPATLFRPVVDNSGFGRVASRRYAAHQASIIGPKPHGAVAGIAGTHHDVGTQGTVLGSILPNHLAALRVVDQDTPVVGTNPVVAMAVFRNSIDVAQLNTIQAGHALHVLVGTILVSAYPHTA